MWPQSNLIATMIGGKASISARAFTSKSPASSGNPVLVKFMEELALRTSLIIAQFEPPGAEDHCPRAHPRIAEKILARDKAGAIKAMDDHLNEMQARLRLEGTEGEDGIATIFQSLGIVPMSKRKSARRGKA